MRLSISDYVDALATSKGRFRTLGEVEALRDARGEIRFYAGNNAVIFPLAGGRMLKCYMQPPRHVATIYPWLSAVCDSLLSPCRFLEDEIFVHDFRGEGVFCDVVLADWVEGITLETAIRRASREGGFEKLSVGFDHLAQELLAREWAHGDLKPDNIIVRPDGSMCLVDYDAMWVPALEGETTVEVGTPQYQHIKRDVNFFCKAIDDFPVALISVSLRALALNSSLYARHNHGDNIILYPEGGAALNEVMHLFSKHGQWHSLRLADALQAPLPQIEGLRAMMAASAMDALSDLSFSGGIAPICLLGKWKIVDSQGVMHAQLEGYDMVKPFSEGVAAVRRDGLWGFVDVGGLVVVEPRFELAGSMHEGLAVVKSGGKYGFVDSSGAMVIAPEWDYAMSFRAGRAFVSRGGEDFVIDKKGAVLYVNRP